MDEKECLSIFLFNAIGLVDPVWFRNKKRIITVASTINVNRQ